jgi:hypothetical protein
VRGRAFRRVGRSHSALLLVVGGYLFATRALADEEAVRVVYAAPAVCPDEQVFIARVRDRTQHGRFAAPGELARTFDVALTESAPGAGFTGQIEFTDTDGQRAHRKVADASCDEVASSLALIMALSIDDRVALAESAADGPSPSPPSVAHGAPPKENTPSAAARPMATASATPHALRRLSWQLGANAGALSWLTSDITPMFGAFVALGSREHAWSARFSGFDARRISAASGGRQAHFATDWLRAEFCPLALPAQARLSMAPCAAFDVGALNAAARGGAVRALSTKPVPWAAGVALLRLDWEIAGHLMLSLDGELGVPLIRHDFSFENADGSTSSAFHVPALGAGVKAGVGLRFP